MCKYILVTLLFTHSIVNSYAQREDLLPREILNEQFSARPQNWDLESADLVMGGRLLVPKKGVRGKISTQTTKIYVDQTRNYQIETVLTYKGKDRPYCLIIGKLYWKFIRRGFSRRIQYTGLGRGFGHIPRNSLLPKRWYKYKLSSGQPYTYRVQKVGERTTFYINGDSIFSGKFKQDNPFRVGFLSDGQPYESDYLRVRYLDSAESNLPVPQPVEAERVRKPALSQIKYYALIIGVSKYDDGSLTLQNPVHDATLFKNMLVSKYSFPDSTTKLITNPTRKQIISELYRLRRKVTASDNLLIFYAGHGYWDEQAKQGYWWPKDAGRDDPTNWLSNSDLREQIRGIPSAHTLLISDACFSGGIFRARGVDVDKEIGIEMQKLHSMPSRRAMTSGTMTTVSDDSVFLKYILKRLKENDRTFLTSQQLFDSIKLPVIHNSLTVPQDGVITDTGDEGGDFIFKRVVK